MDTAPPNVIEDTNLDEMLEAAVPPPVCEWVQRAGDEPCGAPATWIMSAACGHSAYYDDAHHAALVAAGIGDASTGPTWCANEAAPHHLVPMKADPIIFTRIAS